VTVLQHLGGAYHCELQRDVARLTSPSLINTGNNWNGTHHSSEIDDEIFTVLPKRSGGTWLCALPAFNTPLEINPEVPPGYTRNTFKRRTKTTDDYKRIDMYMVRLNTQID
jgi:hypothetical protein